MKIRGWLMAMAALLPAAARAAEPPCLAPAEFTALAAYSLPSVLQGIGQRCAASLPADAFLRREGPAMAARYAAGKQAHWPAAKRAFLKIGTAAAPEMQNILGALPDETLQPMADLFISAIVAEKLGVERCPALDRLLQLAAPLPAAATAEMIGLAVGLGSRNGLARFGKIVICTP